MKAIILAFVALTLVVAALADIPTPRPNIPAVDPDIEAGHILSANDWLALFVFVTLWYTHPFGFDWRYYINKHYKKRVAHMKEKHEVKMIPLRWLGLSWFIIYGFVATGVFLFWRNFPVTSALEIAIWSLILANYFLNKGWGLFITMPGAGILTFTSAALVGLSAAGVATMGYIEKAYWLAGSWTGYAAYSLVYLYFLWYYWAADKHITKKEKAAQAGGGESIAMLRSRK